MRLQIRRLMASAVWLSRGAGLSVAATGDSNTLANAVITGSGITLLGSAYTGAADASGTFTGGFYNIKSGVILTSGEAAGATGGSRDTDNGQPGYPGVSSVNAAVLTLNIRIEAGYTGFELEFVFATADTSEATLDAFGVSVGGSLTTFDISHPFMSSPPATVPPNSPLPYRRTSPPLLMGFTTGAGVFDVDLVVYDELDASYDSAALVRMKPCVACAAVGPVIYYPPDEETTTTSEEPTTTTEAETTTTTDITTTEDTTTTTADTTTTEETTTTTEEITTTTEDTTTTADTTTATDTTTTMGTTTAIDSTTTTDSTLTTDLTTSIDSTTTDTTTTDDISTTTDTITTDDSTTTTDLTTSIGSISIALTTTTTDSTTTLESTTTIDSVTTTSPATTTDLTTTGLEQTVEPEDLSTTVESSTETRDSTTGAAMSTATTDDSTTTRDLATTTGTMSTESLGETTSISLDTSAQIPDTTSSIADSTSNAGSDTMHSLTNTRTSTGVTTTRSPGINSIPTSFSASSRSIAGSAIDSTSSISMIESNRSEQSEPSTTNGPFVSSAESPSTDAPVDQSSTDFLLPETLVEDTSSLLFPIPESSSTMPDPRAVSSTTLPGADSVTIDTTAPSSPLATAGSSSTSTVSGSIPNASNLPAIGRYIYLGCLSSEAGYPSFNFVGSDPGMTPEICISLAEGRRFVGVHDRSCYAADSLDSASLTVNGRCNLPCPGDAGLFCGGFVNARAATRDRRHQREQRLSRRDAPPNILLTLYLFAEASQVSSSESIVLGTPTISPDRTAISRSNSEDISPSSTLNDPARTTGLVVESGDASPSSTFNDPDQTSVSAFNSEAISLNPTLDRPGQTSTFVEDSEDVSLTDLPPSVPTTYLLGVNPPPLPSGAFSMGNFSRAETLEAIVTTVVYTILDPQDPAYLTVAEFCTTLKYPPCRNCQYQKVPTVEMTTIQTACDACGYHGESIIELTIPLGANPALVTGNSYIPEDGPDGSPAADHNENSRPEFRPGEVEARPTVVPVGHSPNPSKANGYGEHARPVIQHGGDVGDHGKERPSPGENHSSVGEPGSAPVVDEKLAPSQHSQVPSNDNGESAGSGDEPQETKTIGSGKNEAIVKPSLAPSAEAPKAVPKPDPAGASAELKLSTVPLANILSTPPDSPVIVAAGHVARGIDGVLTFLALVAGLFLVL